MSSSSFLVPAVPSHRGYGFSLGHPQFQLPSRTAPVKRDAQGLARSLTPERMRGGAGHHGSAELGSVSRGRERDRGRGGSTQSGTAPMVTDSVIGDPLRQAQAYRSTPVGPQEAEEWAGALDTVINRLVSIEAAQRKQAAVLSKHEECLQLHSQQNDWLKRHADNC